MSIYFLKGKAERTKDPRSYANYPGINSSAYTFTVYYNYNKFNYNKLEGLKCKFLAAYRCFQHQPAYFLCKYFNAFPVLSVC